MNIYLGNIQFNEIEGKLGYKLTDDDKELWDALHSQNADLSSKDSCFHVFDMPRCIKFKGDKAKEAILKMFTSEKLVNPMGKFEVYEVSP